MLKENFSTAKFVELTPAAIPSILGYDNSNGRFVIGEAARSLASVLRPVVQDFKLYVAESDALFEGRYTPVKTARSQRLWSSSRSASTAVWFVALKAIIGQPASRRGTL